MSDTKIKAGFSDPFSPVEVEPIHVGGQEVATKVAVRVRDDSNAWQLAGIVSKDYQLMPNRRVRDVAEDIMSRTPGDFGGFENLKTLYDGKRYVDYFASRNPITSFNGRGPKQDLKLGLMVWNSYDLSRATGFEVFALNPWCTNQYHSRNRFGFFAFRHTPGNGVDVEDGIASVSRGVENIIRIAPLIGDLRGKLLDLTGLRDAKAKVEIPQTRWGDVLDSLGTQGDDAGNLFGLYQALTDVATHKLSGLSSINVGTSITEHFLPALPERPVTSHSTASDVIHGDDERQRLLSPARSFDADVADDE